MQKVKLTKPWEGAVGLPSTKAPGELDNWLGSRVRLRRLQVGWSAERLGQEVGVSRQQIEKWETGKSRITGGRLSDLGRVLEVHPGTFFDGHPAVQMPAGAAAALNGISTADGITMLTAFNVLLPDQKRAIRSMIAAFQAANTAEATLGPASEAVEA